MQVTLLEAPFTIWNKSSGNLFSISIEISSMELLQKLFPSSLDELPSKMTSITSCVDRVFFLWLELQEAVFQLSAILFNCHVYNFRNNVKNSWRELYIKIFCNSSVATSRVHERNFGEFRFPFGSKIGFLLIGTNMYLLGSKGFSIAHINASSNYSWLH